MVKKSVKHKTTNHKRHLKDAEIQLALIENFINLQKVLTELTSKFDNLSSNISRLLFLFEESAKSFVEKNKIGSDDKELLNKLDTLLDQNKTVAKGLTLIEEKMRHKLYGDHPKEETKMEEPYGRPRPRPLPKI